MPFILAFTHNFTIFSDFLKISPFYHHVILLKFSSLLLWMRLSEGCHGKPSLHQNTRNPQFMLFTDGFPLKGRHEIIQHLCFKQKPGRVGAQGVLMQSRHPVLQKCAHNRTFLFLSTTFLMLLMKNMFLGGLTSACSYCHKQRAIYGKNSNSRATLI